MKRIIALFALCSIGMALHGGYICKAGKIFPTKEECDKQCPSGCEFFQIDISGGLR